MQKAEPRHHVRKTDMKYLILLLFCCTTKAQAQEAKTLKNPAYPDLYVTPNSEIIDTGSIRKLNDKFYTGAARQDRMPVLIPYRTGKSIANAGKGIGRIDRMPNLWNKPKDRTVRHQSFYKRPLYYDTAPLSAK